MKLEMMAKADPQVSSTLVARRHLWSFVFPLAREAFSAAFRLCPWLEKRRMSGAQIVGANHVHRFVRSQKPLLTSDSEFVFIWLSLPNASEPHRTPLSLCVSLRLSLPQNAICVYPAASAFALSRRCRLPFPIRHPSAPLRDRPSVPSPPSSVPPQHATAPTTTKTARARRRLPVPSPHDRACRSAARLDDLALTSQHTADLIDVAPTSRLP